MLGLILVSRVGAQVAQVEEAQQPQHSVLLHVFEGSRALCVDEGVEPPVHLASTLLWDRLLPLLHFLAGHTPMYTHVWVSSNVNKSMPLAGKA